MYLPAQAQPELRIVQTDDCATDESKASNDGAFGVAKLVLRWEAAWRQVSARPWGGPGMPNNVDGTTPPNSESDSSLSLSELSGVERVATGDAALGVTPPMVKNCTLRKSDPVFRP